MHAHTTHIIPKHDRRSVHAKQTQPQGEINKTALQFSLSVFMRKTLQYQSHMTVQCHNNVSEQIRTREKARDCKPNILCGPRGRECMTSAGRERLHYPHQSPELSGIINAFPLLSLLASQPLSYSSLKAEQREKENV